MSIFKSSISGCDSIRASYWPVRQSRSRSMSVVTLTAPELDDSQDEVLSLVRYVDNRSATEHLSLLRTVLYGNTFIPAAGWFISLS